MFLALPFTSFIWHFHIIDIWIIKNNHLIVYYTFTRCLGLEIQLSPSPHGFMDFRSLTLPWTAGFRICWWSGDFSFSFLYFSHSLLTFSTIKIYQSICFNFTAWKSQMSQVGFFIMHNSFEILRRLDLYSSLW